MDFDLTQEELAFQQEVRDFIDANSTLAEDGSGRRTFALDWNNKLREKKWIGFSWPEEVGGGGGSIMEQVILKQEMAAVKAPPLGTCFMGLAWVGPGIIEYGTQSQKERFIPDILDSKYQWCTGYSEPNVGSDLASLQCKGVREGDSYIVNGQKIWTSFAHKADWGVLLARSDPEKSKHDGLTFFYLSTKTPGVEIRQIKQMSGARHFNETFFRDVRIPDSQRLGPVDGGWKVAISLLMGERNAIADDFGPAFQELHRLAVDLDLDDGRAIDDPSVRQRLAEFYVKAQGLRFTRYRIMTALARGETPGPEASIGKLVAARMIQDAATYGLDLMDMAGVATGSDMPLDGIFELSFLDSPAFRIAGGTDEILRNTIGERVLGLPQEVRVDKGVPFKSIPTGGR